jgi:ribosomal protein L5
MYIAFDLPDKYGGSTAAWMNHIQHQELAIWYQKYTIAYQIKTVKNVTRVAFASDEMYSFFALTWNPKHPELRNYRMVEPMKLDNS